MLMKNKANSKLAALRCWLSRLVGCILERHHHHYAMAYGRKREESPYGTYIWRLCDEKFQYHNEKALHYLNVRLNSIQSND